MTDVKTQSRAVFVAESKARTAAHAENAASHSTRKPTTSLSPSPSATVYEGPLDLLLDLIRKQDIDIYDIPIAKITAQYLTLRRAHEASSTWTLPPTSSTWRRC